MVDDGDSGDGEGEEGELGPVQLIHHLGGAALAACPALPSPAPAGLVGNSREISSHSVHECA